MNMFSISLQKVCVMCVCAFDLVQWILSQFHAQIILKSLEYTLYYTTIHTKYTREGTLVLSKEP